jgi:uncharacterized protein YdbL (DUF1318 family)
MKNSFFRSFILAAVLLLGAAAVTVRAEDLPAVKARMAQRLSKIDSLKASGAIGETNRGMVAVRGGGGDAASVVAEENRDREEVYAAIAKRTGSTADAVGTARAKQIASASAPGVWIQRDDGSWAKK